MKEGPTVAATYVSWEDAVSFCRKLTEQERSAGRLPAGWEYRLPSEAEWEYACRAGSETAYSFGDDARRLGDFEWFYANAAGVGENYVHAAGSKKPNPWGLFDVHGNVREWCRDWHAEKLAGGRDPVGLKVDSIRVSRGGSWGGLADECRSAFRSAGRPDHRYFYLGFRVALAPVRAAKAE